VDRASGFAKGELMNWTPRLILAVASIAGAALIMAIGALGAAFGESRLAASAMDALARQPDESSSISRSLFVSLAMIESTAIFCLVLALILLFANPFTGMVGG
jgi:F-type H+-transporting ATPase subunit c